ncbi:hypothetical protein FRB97_009096 [Tulasnella sp. 331]|nr:hypothetical protein FRB97_009096 [Tulasnella sp. 331]
MDQDDPNEVPPVSVEQHFSGMDVDSQKKIVFFIRCLFAALQDQRTNDIVKWGDVDCIGQRDGECICKHSGEYFVVLNEGKLIKMLQDLGAIRTGDSDSLKKRFNNLYIRKLNRANKPDTGTPESGAYYHVAGKLLRDKPELLCDIVRKGQKVAGAPQGLHMDTTISSGSTLSQAEEPPLRQDALTKVLNENRLLTDEVASLKLVVGILWNDYRQRRGNDTHTDNSTANNLPDFEASMDPSALSGASQGRYYAPMSVDPQSNASPGHQNPLVNPEVSSYHSAGGARWDETPLNTGPSSNSFPMEFFQLSGTGYGQEPT